MKNKKGSHSRIEKIPSEHSKSKNRPIDAHHLRSNKQNILQLTEPLEPTSIASLSKQFILSRQSLTLNSRPNLREITRDSNSSWQQKRQKKIKVDNRQEEAFDRRLSLKCANDCAGLSGEYERLSMGLPLRKDRIANDERMSLGDGTNASFVGETKARHNIKREVIITNLINKLEHQQDLRSIIQSKLKISQAYQPHQGRSSHNPHPQLTPKDRKNQSQSYLSEFTEESHANSSQLKLKDCENELRYFKQLIKEMEEKMTELSEQKRFAKKREGAQGMEMAQSQIKKDEVAYFMSLVQRIRPALAKCQTCEKQHSKAARQIATQTPNQQLLSGNHHQLNQSFDFLDNLEKTLKVLDHKRK